MTQRPRRAVVYFVLALVVGLTASGAVLFFTLRPPMTELMGLLALLSATGVVSLLAAMVAYQSGLLYRFGSLRWMLLASYGLPVGLILLNVWLLAKLMLLSQQYLTLTSVVLGFSAIIAMGIGFVIAAAVSGTISELVGGANTLAEGDLSARVPVRGNNELADLASAFNEMAQRLSAMTEQERAMEQERRDLITWVSHDLRTPLTSLMVILEALTDGLVTDEAEESRYLGTALVEAHNLGGLIDDLFDLVQFDAGHLQLNRESSSLHDLISDTLESWHARAEQKRLTLTGEVSPEVDPVYMAPDKVQRVLSNLIGNAVRYTPPGGTIHLLARRENSRVVVAVRDTGPGIAAKDLPRVFDAFHRGEAARTRNSQAQGDRGVGLGLAIAKAFVEAHGGSIEVESREGAGAEFRFTLPRPSS